MHPNLTWGFLLAPNAPFYSTPILFIVEVIPLTHILDSFNIDAFSFSFFIFLGFFFPLLFPFPFVHFNLTWGFLLAPNAPFYSTPILFVVEVIPLTHILDSLNINAFSFFFFHFSWLFFSFSFSFSFRAPQSHMGFSLSTKCPILFVVEVVPLTHILDSLNIDAFSFFFFHFSWLIFPLVFPFCFCAPQSHMGFSLSTKCPILFVVEVVPLTHILNSLNIDAFSFIFFHFSWLIFPLVFPFCFCAPQSHMGFSLSTKCPILFVVEVVLLTHILDSLNIDDFFFSFFFAFFSFAFLFHFLFYFSFPFVHPNLSWDSVLGPSVPFYFLMRSFPKPIILTS